MNFARGFSEEPGAWSSAAQVAELEPLSLSSCSHLGHFGPDFFS